MGIGLILTGVMVGLIAYFVLSATGPVEAVADRFMTALQEKAYRRAAQMLSIRTQDGFGPEELSMLTPGPPLKWSWRLVSVSGETAQVEGPVSFANDESGRVSLYLIREDGVWVIDEIVFSTR